MTASNTINTVVVLGPTASGKTRLGVQLAHAFGGEVLSADSRQVYRGLDIGSGKDLSEYEIDGARVPYHLIDIVDLDYEFNVFDFQQRFYEAFEQVRARGALPVVVGGTGLYLEAAILGYRMVAAPRNDVLRAELDALTDSELVARLVAAKQGKLHNTTDIETRDRIIREIEIAEYARDHEPPPAPDVRPLVLGTLWDRAVLRERIRVRLRERFLAGMLDEARHLHDNLGYSWERLERLGLEYRFMAEYLQGKLGNRNDLLQKLAAAICQFAKRQDTWFRRMERNGTHIHWVPRGDFDTARAIVEAALDHA